MDCALLASRIHEFLEGTLPEAEHEAALEHLAECHACEIVLAETRDVADLVDDDGHTALTNDDRSRMLGNVIDEVAE